MSEAVVAVRAALLRGPLRRGAIGVLAGSAVVVAALGVLFTGDSQADAFDAPLDSALRDTLGRHPGLTGPLATLGTFKPVFALTALLVLACLALRHWRGAILAAVSVLVAIESTEHVLKPLTDRTIRGFLSFPSGHATSMFALATVLAILLAQPQAGRVPRAVRTTVLVVAFAVATLVGLAMVSLSFHYVTDVVAGAAVGIGVTMAVALIIDRIADIPHDDGAGGSTRAGARRRSPQR